MSDKNKKHNAIESLIYKEHTHHNCKGFKTVDVGQGSDYDCGYETTISCDECKYGGGRKNPESKCNNSNNSNNSNTLT